MFEENPAGDLIVKSAKRTSETTWEIPVSFKKGMRVPALIFASENLVRNMDAKVLDQLTNVACLQGIQKYAYCMPDAHTGYGFPIGGVAAFDPKEGGIISPGGIGFDINCIASDSKVLDENGATHKIEEMESSFESHLLHCFDLNKRIGDSASAKLFLKQRPRNSVWRLRTLTGNEIIATSDHPLFTPSGMLELEKLEVGSRIAVYPFEGVPFEQPNELVVLDKKNIRSLPFPLNRGEVIDELNKRSLLPLLRNDHRVPSLIKLLSYSIGDGSLVVVGKSQKAMAWFYGEKEDLEDLRKDILKLGYSPSKVYERTRDHQIQTKYSLVSFTDTEYSVRVSSQSFVALLAALGGPLKNKAKQEYRIPEWIRNGPLWHQRLFLAAYFGAEMSAPKTMSDNEKTFYMPTVGVNKHEDLSSLEFLNDLKDMLGNFSVKAFVSNPVESYINAKGVRSFRTRIEVYSDTDNLVKFFGRVGFVYNRRKFWLSLLATHYLKFKEAVVNARCVIGESVSSFSDQGCSRLVQQFKSDWVNERFIQRSFYEGRSSSCRIPSSFPSFQDFCEIASENLGSMGAVWDVVIEKEEIEYNDYVYDFTMAHDGHNFVANSFVVSNCGMRLVRTNLTFEEVKPKLKQLVDLLFKLVPAGVGCRGSVRLSQSQLSEVMSEGAKWCVNNGYGWKEDLERIEDYGKISWADPSQVSDRAVQRGLSQLGTLGSGNHYLEIQVVKEENIFDKDLAKRLGIFANQIVVMVHCGSRGFGHQIGTDYLKLFLDVMPKYNIEVLDRELACAPFESSEGQNYFKAMACAANLAFANRQVILHQIREAFKEIFRKDSRELEMDLVYDVAHNIAKLEKHKIDGKLKEVVMHRKGATRCFGPEREELASIFRKTGQPVIVGGSMETGSYLLAGTSKASDLTFGSTMHGAGRTMSRTKAKHSIRGADLQREMLAKGIYVHAVSMPGLAEEAGAAYKDINEVVETMEVAGVSKRVARFLPIGNVKG